MSQQTSFDIQDARDLRAQLTQLRDLLRQEWRGVSLQANNLRMSWHDSKRDVFDDHYRQQIESPYADVERELDEYIEFINNQLRIAEDLNQRLGDL